LPAKKLGRLSRIAPIITYAFTFIPAVASCFHAAAISFTEPNEHVIHVCLPHNKEMSSTFRSFASGVHLPRRSFQLMSSSALLRALKS
jgi:hypothetical protein